MRQLGEQLDRAIVTALEHIPIVKRVRRDPVGSTIVDDRGTYRVYSEDAWDEPTERPMLAWHPPSGKPVVHVDIDGIITFLEEEPCRSQ